MSTHTDGWRGGRSRGWLITAIIAINTVPFAPVYPGYSHIDDFFLVWLGGFWLFSAPFWAAVGGLWWLNRRRSPAVRSVLAESPGLIQAMIFLPWWWGTWLVLLIPVVRTVDGILLYRLALDQRRADSGTPAVARIDEGT